MNYTEVYTFRKESNETAGPSVLEAAAQSSYSSRANGHSYVGGFVPDAYDYTDYSSKVKDNSNTLENGLVFTNPAGKVVTKVSYNNRWSGPGNSLVGIRNSAFSPNLPPISQQSPRFQGGTNRRALLAGAGQFAQNANLQNIGQRAGFGNVYGRGGYGGSYGGYGHSQIPQGFTIRGPQNINLGGLQNANLRLNLPFTDLNICPDIILSLIVLAAAVAAGGLYLAITGAGRRRRKRSSVGDRSAGVLGTMLTFLTIGRSG